MTRIAPFRTAVYGLWLSAIMTGFSLILNYQNVGGLSGETPTQWPSESQIALDSKRGNLVMFAHPKCPCTRASLEELNRLLARTSIGKVTTQVWFLKPPSVPNDWTRTDLWQSVRDMPGVTAHEDAEGAEARRFGATTSGYVVLYNKDGELLFRGGITGSRGHAGDNAGENIVIALLAGQNASVRQTHVFGCPLQDHCDISSDNFAN